MSLIAISRYLVSTDTVTLLTILSPVVWVVRVIRSGACVVRVEGTCVG